MPKNANIDENDTGKKIECPNEASLEVQTLIKGPVSYKKARQSKTWTIKF